MGSRALESQEQHGGNKLQYLESKSHQSQLVFMQLHYPGRIEIRRCWSLCGRKIGEPEENPRTMARTNKQPTYDTWPESHLGHIAAW